VGRALDQTTAASTAKHQTAVVLHHQQPQRMETMMAVATLTLPDRNATLPVPAAPAIRPTILALDLGTTTGWALRALDGLITSGTVSFRAQPVRRRRHALSALHQLAD
jgi:hypothetical protein